jgi:mannosyltransferase
MKFNSIINIQVPQDDETHNKLLNCFILIPGIFATYLSFLYLDAKSFWLDEAFSVSFVNSSWSQLWEIVSRKEPNMSLYYVLLKIWVMAFGDSEFAARSLSVIFAIGVVIMTYAVGVHLFNIPTGLTSSLILAVNAFFISYAQEARSYMLLLLLIILSMYLFIRAIEMQRYKYYIYLGLINALVLYCHFLGFFVLFAQVMSLVFLPIGTIRWRRIITSAILTASLTAPLIFFIWTHGTSEMGLITHPSLRGVYYIFVNFTGNGPRLLLMSYFIPCFLSFAILVRILVSFKKSNILYRYGLLFFWLFVPILCLYLISIFKPFFFINRYMFSCLPALTILAGAGLMSFRYMAIRVIATSLLIVLSLYTVFAVYYPQKKEDWRSATRLIFQNAKAGDAILFYGTPALIPFEYYYEKMKGETDILVSVYPFPFGTPIGLCYLTKESDPSESMLESLPERFNRLWVVLSHDIHEGQRRDSRPIIYKIERKYINRENIFFEGINVKLYVKDSVYGKSKIGKWQEQLGEL